MAIRISKHQLYIGAASLAMMAFIAIPAQAQYHTLKSQEPQVELNLDRLSSGEAGPAARPLWEPKTETPANQVPAGTPPIKLRQPLKMPPQTATLPAPSVADVPVAAAAQQPQAEPAAQAVDTPATTEAVGEPAAPARVLKPVFAAPVVPPAAAVPDAAPQTTEEAAEVQAAAPAEAQAAAPAEAQAATPAVNMPAVPVPADNPVPAAPVHTAIPELKPAKLMDPILEPQKRRTCCPYANPK